MTARVLNQQRAEHAELHNSANHVTRAIGQPHPAHAPFLRHFREYEPISAKTLDIPTPHGPARAHLNPVADPIASLALGHGAGGGVGTPDLIATTDAARSAGLTVVLVEQPYRVAGSRSQPAASRLDGAWVAAVERLRECELAGLALVVGGRSAGARVACRTSAATDAVAVLCLAFPLHPPGRADDPDKSRLPELDSVLVPTLVIQGERDPFGMPPEAPNRKVVRVPGNHSLRSTTPVALAVGEWLRARFP